MSQHHDSQASINVRTYRLARDRLGAKELSWSIDEGATVGELLAEIGETYDLDPDAFLVMKNRRNIKQLDGLDTPLSDGDAVTLSIGSLSE